MSALLEARNISIARGGREILRDVSLALHPGKLVAIAGPNGSGKSTLLRALAGIWPVANGDLLLEGKPMARIPRREIARIVSYVPQETQINFGFTVREIVAMGRHPHIGRFAAESTTDRRAIDEALALCDIGHLRHRAVNTLSGGERQRALVARCLAAQPQCILLDEPTASLDLEHALDIFALARRLAAANCAVALSTHDLNNGLRFSTTAVILNHGSIAHNGPGGDTLDDSILESVFRVRAERLSGSAGYSHYVFHRKERSL
jgi:iron complex transport system ATP-binding protein